MKADSKETATLFLDGFAKGGERFINALDWKKISAAGLSAAMVIGAYEVSSGVRQAAEDLGEGAKRVAEKDPAIFSGMFIDLFRWASLPIILPLTLLGLIGAAWAGWKIWRWTRTREAEKKS